MANKEPLNSGPGVIAVEVDKDRVSNSRRELDRHVGMYNRSWTHFFTGPFFKVIPVKRPLHHTKSMSMRRKQYPTSKEEQQYQQDVQEDYLGAIKRIILSRVDTDETYGLTNGELVPLPFDAPAAWEYLVDFLAGTYLVAQATVVMFIAILVANDQLGIVLGDTYTENFLPLIKALVILYPLVTLVVMTMITTEILFRKYFYYRLLSLRILVDWENVPFYRGWFFWYFIATWILMNVWALWGVIRFWDRGTTNGANTVPFTTWVVVNLQTFQLLLYYYRLATSEERLVSLNMLFERAPVEAQLLLTYTYVVEEHVLMEECLEFGSQAVRAFQKRVLNLLSCGYACKDWAKNATNARFELDALKGAADNFEEVEEQIGKLREEMRAQGVMGDSDDEPDTPPGATSANGHNGGGAATSLPSSTHAPGIYPAIPSATSPSTSAPPPPPSFYPTIAPASSPPSHPLAAHPTATAAAPAAGPLAASVAVGRGASLPVAPPPAGLPTASMIGITPPSAVLDATRSGSGGGIGKRPSVASGGSVTSAVAPKPPKAHRPRATRWKRRREHFRGNIFQRAEFWFQTKLYKHFYGTIHGLFTGILTHMPTWPYRGDIPYLRMLLVFELIGMLCVAALVVFGILRATTNNRCATVTKTCNSCYDAANLFSGECSLPFNITKTATSRLFSF